jgi:diguanylate cyclase (GGDEF)-like protein
MNPLVYFIFYIAILFLSYRISLFASLMAALLLSLYVFISQLKHISYETILLILFLNILPFIAEKFKRNFNTHKLLLRRKLEDVRKLYEDIARKDKQEVESNLEIERKIQQVSSLYEISKDMSCCLSFEDIFNIFSSSLKKSFRFRLARLVLIKDSKELIDSVYQIELGRPPAKAAPDKLDKELIDIAFEIKKEVVITAQGDSPFYRRIAIIKDFETLISMPIIAEDRIVGVFYIENMPYLYFDNFIILTNQFAIQLQKIILYKKIQEMAITDSLTEVSTRRYFLERFSEEIRRSMRRKTNLSFLMLDLDHFKEKNDSYGHLVGDVILKEIANVLKSSLREIDIIGRYGGEEFGIVLTGIGREGSLQVAERLRSGIEHVVFTAYDETVSTTVSIGISVFPDDGVDRNSLIESADRALYKAKAQGRNRVYCLYS